MKKSTTHYKRFLVALVMCFMFLWAPSQTVNISGTVINSNGDLISDALIRLKKYPDILTYSAANGTFNLSSIPSGIGDIPENEKCIIENGIIKVFCENEPVRIDVYDITGKLLKNIVNLKSLSGYHDFTIGNIVIINSSLLILRVNIGQDYFNYKYFSNSDGVSSAHSAENTARNLKKNTLATIDTLLISHNSYQTKRIALSSYSLSLGDVLLTSAVAENFVFNGGTLQDLINANSNLNFGNLEINGSLEIPSSESSVTIHATNITLNRSIYLEYPTCSPYFDGPDLTLNATGDVIINAGINLDGHSGKGETASSTCNSCYGTDGGNLTINAANIYVNNRLSAGGGSGSYSYISSSMKCGCSGGDAGKINLFAVHQLNINQDGTDLDVDGGDGGTGSLDCGNGAEGKEGLVDFSGQNIIVAESGGDMNMYDYHAQMLDYEKLTVNGSVCFQEELNHRNNYGSWYMSFTSGFKDWLEDLYVLCLGEPSSVIISLSASDPNADLDLYLISEDMKTTIGESIGATSNENISTAVLTAGKYFIAVSYADDGKPYSTNYALKLKQ